MKSERIVWGLIFLFIGGVLLLDNFGMIDFQWGIIWRFWPLVLIILGVNMLFPNDDSNRGGIISIIITIAALVFIGYQGSKPQEASNLRFRWNEKWQPEIEEENDGEGKLKENFFSEPMEASTKYAVLNIEGGATKYSLKDTTSELFYAEVKKRGGDYSLFKTSNDSTEELNFSMSGKHKFGSEHIGGGRAFLKLNTKPVWDLNVEVGAGKVDFDLSAFKVRNLNLEGGAASFYFKLGQPEKLTTINTETGASAITIAIPESAACEIHTETGLSSNEFDGFVKRSDGVYVTPEHNYMEAKQKFVIRIEAGLSSAKVKRY
jgi:hypothetical protein